MNKQISSLVFSALLLSGTCSHAADNAAEVACATFARNGTLAGVSISNGGLRLHLVNDAKSQDASTQKVSSEVSNCELFFSTDNQWLAIGAERAVPSGWSVRVQVWDVRQAAWHKQFDVDPRPGLAGHVALAGFFGKDDKLVIIGRREDTRDAPLTSMLVSVEGQLLDGPGYARESPAEVDAERNRVWTSKGTDRCTMFSATLIGDLVKGPAVNRPAIQGNCIGPFPVGFPASDTIIGAASDGDARTWAWSVSVDMNKSNKASLAAPPKTHADKWVQATIQPFLSISPDGQAFAILRTSTHWNHFDNPGNTVNEVLVGTVEPLRFLQVVGPVPSCSAVTAFAVDHHPGKVTIAGRWCGEWKTIAVPAFEQRSIGDDPRHPAATTPTLR